MTDPLIHDARALADTNPTLVELIRFTRSHDPTDDFRQRWSESFEARRDNLSLRRWTNGYPAIEASDDLHIGVV